jgi:hypothetical protein
MPHHVLLRLSLTLSIWLPGIRSYLLLRWRVATHRAEGPLLILPRLTPQSLGRHLPHREKPERQGVGNQQGRRFSRAIAIPEQGN